MASVSCAKGLAAPLHPIGSALGCILGYIAYDAHGTYLTFTRYVAGHVRSHENIPITQLGADYFTTMRISAQAGDAARQRRDNALIALPVIPIGLPLLWLAFLWVSAGFRQS